MNKPCPCGNDATYQACCQRFHSGAERPLTAEQLMRSRFSAFAKGLVSYLLQTRHPSKRSIDNAGLLQESCNNTHWVRLEIHKHKNGGRNDTEGFVSFSAHYVENGQPGTLSETSRFLKEGQQWYYVEGDITEDNSTEDHNTSPVKLGRNDSCWCGSGKKFKRCHG